jgi:ABC-type transport system involved in cytochrome c biogenesis ATPase subunit
VFGRIISGLAQNNSGEGKVSKNEINETAARGSCCFIFHLGALKIFQIKENVF